MSGGLGDERIEKKREEVCALDIFSAATTISVAGLFFKDRGVPEHIPKRGLRRKRRSRGSPSWPYGGKYVTAEESLQARNEYNIFQAKETQFYFFGRISQSFVLRNLDCEL